MGVWEPLPRARAAKFPPAAGGDAPGRPRRCRNSKEPPQVQVCAFQPHRRLSPAVCPKALCKVKPLRVAEALGGGGDFFWRGGEVEAISLQQEGCPTQADQTWLCSVQARLETGAPRSTGKSLDGTRPQISPIAPSSRSPKMSPWQLPESPPTKEPGWHQS